MKKIIAMLLCLVLLGCAAGLAEEAAEKQSFGSIRVNGEFTLKGILPDGYRIIPFELSDDAILSRIQTNDPTKPEMMLSIAYDETYSDVERLNDLDDEALAVLESSFTDTDPYANIYYDETEHGTRLLICRTQSDNYDYLVIFSIYNGYFVEFMMKPGKEAAEQKLTDDEVASCNVFLSELDFVPGIEVPKVKVNGKTFTAVINGFDAEAKTIDVSLMAPIVLTEWQAVSINEGDTIMIGTDEVKIETLSYDGDDAIINDEYYLEKNDDGLYNARLYESPVLEEVKAMTVSIADSVVFTEDIDPETGVVLDEAKTLTAADFFAALAAVTEETVGFDSRNVSITFDDNGDVSAIERFYAPWQ